MALTSWLLFGFGLGVIFTASTLSYFARMFIKAFDKDLEQAAKRLVEENSGD